MLTITLRPEITERDLSTNKPYFDLYLKDKAIKVGFVTDTKLGIRDENGFQYTIPRDFTNEWLEGGINPEPFKTVGEEQLKARLV
jgi:hypothetical protein